MTKSLKPFWWLVALRGVFAICIGFLALCWPGLTLVLFIALFGLFVLVEGVFTAITGLVSAQKNKHWWVLVLEGALGLFVGWLIFARPNFIAFSIDLFVQIIALWLIFSGVIKLIFAIFV